MRQTRMILILTGSGLLAITAGCGAPEASPSAGDAPASLDPEDYVPTPAGWYHRSCVHEVEDGARLDGSNTVTRRDGTTYKLAPCGFPARRTKGAPPPPTDSGWVEDSETQIASGNWYTKMTASWTVPAKPALAFTKNQVFYLFPGLVPAATLNGTIIQPVLQYNYVDTNAWQIASWECGPSICAPSTPVGVSPGDVISGSMVASGCGPTGSCSWTITTEDVTTGQSTKFVADDGTVYDEAYGGALEVYNLTTCEDFPVNGPTVMSGIALYDKTSTKITPTWTTEVYAQTPSCGLGVSATATTTTLDYTGWICTPGADQSCCPFPDGCSCDGDQTCNATGSKWGPCMGAGEKGHPCP